MNKRSVFIVVLIMIFFVCFFVGMKEFSDKFRKKTADKISPLPKVHREDIPPAEPNTAEKQEQAPEEISPTAKIKGENTQGDSLCRQLGALDLLRQAQEFEKNGNLEKAVGKYEEALKLDSCMDSAYNDLGNLYYRKGDYAAAVENFKKALALKKRAAYYNNLGNAYYGRGEYSEAILEYERALKIEEGAYIYNNLGDAYLKKGSVFIAINYFKKAVCLKPDYLLAYKNLTRAYLLKNDYQQIEEMLLTAIKNYPQEFFFYFELSKVYETQTKYKEELKLLQEYRVFNPPNKFVEEKIRILKNMDTCRPAGKSSGLF